MFVLDTMTVRYFAFAPIKPVPLIRVRSATTFTTSKAESTFVAVAPMRCDGWCVERAR